MRNIGYVSLSEVNPDFINMLLRLEDKRFYSHNGVDFLSIGAAIKDRLISNRLRGASTINMQFIRGYMGLSDKSRILRKIEEIYFSILLDIKWEKGQILEAYLNTVPIKGEVVGIYTASWGMFEKSPEFLNDVESVILLALIRDPSSSKEDLIKRSRKIASILNIKYQDSALLNLVEKVYMPVNIKREYNYLPVVSDKLLIKYPSPCITTIDLEIQKRAIEIVKSFVSDLKKRNLNDAALIVADNKSGEILAYVPNALSYSSKKYVVGVIAKRQAGSTLKPFLYEYAIEKKNLTAASILQDMPIYLGKDKGIYSPQNYDGTYKGYVSVRTALASSLNIPAVRTILNVGVENYTRHLKDLGFDVSAADMSENYFGESLALGSLDVSLFELVRAYMVFASGGKYKGLKIVKGNNTEERQILDTAAVYIVTSILSDRDARSPTFDLENTLSTPFFTAVKTGTSKDMRDNWCIGFSEHFTVGVWTGNFSGEPMYDVSGAHGASQIWLAMMKELHRKKGSKPGDMPEGLIKKRISYEYNIEPERDEYFISGTEPASGVISIADDTHYKIIYPPDNSIFAIDPDIPVSQQKLFILVNCRDCFLRFQDKDIRLNKGFTMLDMSKGRHTLNLLNAGKKSLDSVNIEIR